MTENKHTPVETFDCQGCRPFCYGGYHMEADKDGLGDYVKADDYLALEKQRDELLDMLKRAVRRLEIAHANGDTIMREWIVDARAAIAKVEGGAA